MLLCSIYVIPLWSILVRTRISDAMQLMSWWLLFEAALAAV